MRNPEPVNMTTLRDDGKDESERHKAAGFRIQALRNDGQRHRRADTWVRPWRYDLSLRFKVSDGGKLRTDIFLVHMVIALDEGDVQHRHYVIALQS